MIFSLSSLMFFEVIKTLILDITRILSQTIKSVRDQRIEEGKFGAVLTVLVQAQIENAVFLELVSLTITIWNEL